MKTRTKIITSITALILSAVLVFIAVVINNNTGKSNIAETPTRTIALSEATAGAGAAAAVALATAAISSVVYDAAEKTQAYTNYQNNKKLDYTVTGLVNGQDSYNKWKFGLRTFDYNGCGVIATYNIMYLLGKKPKLSQVAYDIEKEQGDLLWGFAGTDPTHPYEYFKSKKISVKQYYNQTSFDKVFKNMKTTQYAMVCFWNNKKDKFEGAHFVAVSRNKNGKYTVYNFSSNSPSSTTRSDLTDVMNNGKGSLICGLIVN